MQDLEMIEKTARELIAEHAPEGWSFAWSRATETYGHCDYKAKTIRISKPNAAHQQLSQTFDTVLHEIAHAIVGPGHGHGCEWMIIARRLGASPVASQAETADVPLRSVAAPWVGTCPAGHVSPQRFYRKPKRRYSCSACSPRWSEDHILTYTKEAS